jgi:hypothetical protein
MADLGWTIRHVSAVYKEVSYYSYRYSNDDNDTVTTVNRNYKCIWYTIIFQKLGFELTEEEEKIQDYNTVRHSLPELDSDTDWEWSNMESAYRAEMERY